MHTHLFLAKKTRILIKIAGRMLRARGKGGGGGGEGCVFRSGGEGGGGCVDVP